MFVLPVVCNAVKGCFQVMKIVHHHASGHFFYWLISRHWGVNLSKEAIICILSRKYKRFTFAHPVKPGLKADDDISQQIVVFNLF